VANILVYWRWDNYQADITLGGGFNFNFNQERLPRATAVGDTVWAVASVRHANGSEEVYIVARLVVKAKSHNRTGYKYGRYRVWGDLRLCSYYRVEAAAAADASCGSYTSTPPDQ